MSIHFHPLTVKDIRKETADCVSIAFDIPPALEEAFLFHQGQNITFRIHRQGKEIRRSYSICSSPLEPELRVAVKKVSGGVFSTFANEELKKGDVLEVLPPTGRFYTPLDARNKKNYLAFASGSGITPVISLIKSTLALEPKSQFTLVYGNRHRSSIIFFEELEGLKNRYMERFTLIHILSRERTDNPLHHGRINAEKCAQLSRKLLDFSIYDEIFICGPEQMIFGISDFLHEKEVIKKNIHFELFTTPGQHAMESSSLSRAEEGLGPMSRVTVTLDGRAFDFNLEYHGAAILDAALAQGADLPYACKGGVCCTCRARLVEGKVEMDRNYALEPEELEAGFILCCQSHPRSPTLAVDFDQR